MISPATFVARMSRHRWHVPITDLWHDDEASLGSKFHDKSAMQCRRHISSALLAPKALRRAIVDRNSSALAFVQVIRLLPLPAGERAAFTCNGHGAEVARAGIE